MTLDLSVNGFRGFNIFPSKSRESRIFVIDAPKIASGASNGPTEINKPSLEHFYVLKPTVLAHTNAPKMICKFQLAHLLTLEAIFGASMTKICDSRDFEGKMLKPRKPLTERSRVIICFLNGHKWTKF